MKKRNGFVFIETLIVVAILTFSLLMAYSSFSGLVIKEKTRVAYDDSVYLYRTYYLEKFFRNFNLYKVRDYINETNENQGVLVQFGCSADIFYNEEDNIKLCENIMSELHVNRLYLTYKDLGFLQICRDNHSGEGACEILLQGGESSVVNYLLTIGGRSYSISDARDKNEYRIVAEFMEDNSGNGCTSGDECKYYYATISLGEIR